MKEAYLSLFRWRCNYFSRSPGDCPHLGRSRLGSSDSCLSDCFSSSCRRTHLFNNTSRRMTDGSCLDICNSRLNGLYASCRDGPRLGWMYSSRGMADGPGFGRLYPSGHHSATNYRAFATAAARRHDPSRSV